MTQFAIHCLDVGAFNYGDSLLCIFGGTTILIDGGTPRSGAPSASVVGGEDIQHEPIQNQLRKLLKQSGPVTVDLLIVTHCHSDHMGCVPELVKSGTIKCRWALLADPQLGYGITEDSDEPHSSDEMSDEEKLWLALREEPLFGATDEQIAAFIEDAAREYELYVELVNTLRERLDTQCVVYRGPSDQESEGLSGLLAEFKDTGLDVLGPSSDLLLACASRLVGRSEDLVENAIGDGDRSLVDAYKAALELLATQDAEDSADGAAVNCQSLVLRVGPDKHRVLLTGDMQFASPDVGEGTALVKALLKEVNSAGPFEFVKLSHHGATNGQNLKLLRAWGAKRLAISTGSISSKHPTEPTLKALETLQSEGVTWARVDMNGRCTFSVLNSISKLTVERGELNDATRPALRSGDAVIAPTASEPVVTRSRVSSEASPLGEGNARRDSVVDVHVRVPFSRTKVSVTIEIQPGDDPDPFVEPTPRERRSPDVTARRLGGGREMPRLLFVTDAAALAKRIGTNAADALFATIRSANQVLLDARGDALLTKVNEQLNQDAAVKGVVLLGGYDVVPSQILNTLPRELAEHTIRDRDRLQVWSDDGYGDRDRDGVPELPVSRVPDGGSGEFILNAIASSTVARAVRQRSGLRNKRRPFADAVYGRMPGAAPMFTSEPTAPNLPPFKLAGDVLYLMLHGSANDSSVFTGQDSDGGFPTALTIETVPNPCPPVVLAGCCYGALVVDTTARDATPGRPVKGRKIGESIALTCLARGANAFVGCTAVHYSPTQPPPLTFLGEPLHRAFVGHVLKGKAAAMALWAAKVDYAAGIPHRAGARIEEVAYEHKILRQFTCLGLGW